MFCRPLLFFSSFAVLFFVLGKLDRVPHFLHAHSATRASAARLRAAAAVCAVSRESQSHPVQPQRSRIQCIADSRAGLWARRPDLQRRWRLAGQQLALLDLEPRVDVRETAAAATPQTNTSVRGHFFCRRQNRRLLRCAALRCCLRPAKPNDGSTVRRERRLSHALKLAVRRTTCFGRTVNALSSPHACAQHALRLAPQHAACSAAQYSQKRRAGEGAASADGRGRPRPSCMTSIHAVTCALRSVASSAKPGRVAREGAPPAVTGAQRVQLFVCVRVGARRDRKQARAPLPCGVAFCAATQGAGAPSPSGTRRRARPSPSGRARTSVRGSAQRSSPTRPRPRRGALRAAAAPRG